MSEMSARGRTKPPEKGDVARNARTVEAGAPEQNRPVGSQPEQSCGSSQDESLAAGSRRKALERRLVVLSRVLPILRRLQARAAGKEGQRK